MAGLSNYVNSLALGEEHYINSYGGNLSGGQRQRIGIARALWKNADIIFLDEATNAIDPNTEFEILNKIKNEVLDTKMLIQLYFLPLLQKLAETNPKYKEMVDFIGTSPRDNGLISSSMSKVGPALGINMSGYHDALTDCRITIQMYQKIVDLLDQHKNVDISKYQTERIKSIRLK